LFIVFALMALMGAFLVSQAMVSKVILDRDTVSLASIFGTKSIERRKISGYRRNKNGLPQWPDEFHSLIIAGVAGGAVLTYLMFAVSKSAKSNAWVWLITALFMMLHVAASMAMLDGLTETASTPRAVQRLLPCATHRQPCWTPQWLQRD